MLMNAAADLLTARTAKPSRVVVGMISGTSADSIDAAVCRIEGFGLPSAHGPGARVELLHYAETPYPAAIKARILDLAAWRVRDVAELNVLVAEAFADACLETLAGAGLKPEEVDLIGSHGQTVYHHSSVPGAIGATLQIGDGDVIAERTGALVIADFRARDVAAGGEGAPISPFADVILYAPRDPQAPPERRAVLNLGGIANVTVLDPDPARVFGFDTGPANTLLDRLARRISGGTLDCDRDGALARAGRVDEALVETLLAEDAYLARRPPKSTGFEMYGDPFVDRAGTLLGRFDADLMATLTEYTARTVADAFARFVPPVVEVIGAGGGVKNPALFGRLAQLLAPARLLLGDDRGVPGDAREAMAFAVLAHEALFGLPTSLPSVTGARRPAVLGKFCLPRF
ncbi:anhydro-N-acetylmuramic acid kinase [Planctomyces sp. SH-PL62]|uniref:anhydro-N-acetylmuramic acid kinase n=1 Tax=Planctomyces sp. SH-PL62 TaxID=1636152 RepID=UPI00078DA9BB|nr:anhydro-N-acetylmuramic acid kinase [Planctomyces sp. SH-PL62]AMV35817.1 Anhydro-N-acetylmuramic acid kinase [Planctomyces sp. SH-PL62]